MNTIRKALAILGGIALVILLIAVVTPQASRALVAALVQVTNTSANPVPVTSVDGGPNFPFVGELCAAGSQNVCPPDFPNNVTVPTTTSTGLPVKRVVIEQVSADCIVSTFPINATLRTPLPADSVHRPVDTLAAYQFAITTVVPGFSGVIPSAPARIYADPGSFIFGDLEGQFGPGRQPSCQFTLTGHLQTN